MSIATRDQLIAALANAKTISFWKPSITSVAGFMYSHFRNAGVPVAAAIPATAAGNTCDRTLAGALPIPAPVSTSYLAAFAGTLSVLSSWFLYDRLVETGTLNGTLTTAQTVNSVALPARASGATDVELWLEIYTALGATASAVVTASYTNQAGTPGKTATLVGGIPASGGVAQRSYRMTLEAGDTGVLSVESVTLGTSTGTAGAFGIVLRRTISVASAIAGGGFNQGYAETGLAVIPDNACLELLTQSSTTTTGSILGLVRIAQG